MVHTRNRSSRRAVALLVMSVFLAACGGGTNTPTTPTPGPTTPPPFQQHVSEHFTFHYTDLDAVTIADTAARVEANYSRIVSDLGAPSVARVTVFLYRDFASLQAAVHAIAGTLPAFATGLVTNAATIHLLSPNLSTTWSYADAVRAIVHEFAHCVSLVVNPSIANNPRWLWETVAIYEANDFVDPRMLPGMVAGTPPTVTRLNSFDNVDVYRVGYTIGEFIVARWGREGLAALIRNNGNTSQTTGLSLAQFLDEWYAFVRQRYLSSAVADL